LFEDLSLIVLVHDSDKDEKVVRPHVSLLSCLEDLAAPELIEDFYSTAIKGKTTATKYVICSSVSVLLLAQALTACSCRTTRMVTFPKYLVVHLKKYIATESGLPKKLGSYDKTQLKYVVMALTYAFLFVRVRRRLRRCARGTRP